MHRRGITWSFTQHLEDLDYAEYICLLSHRLIDIQAKASDLEKRANAVGLSINASKTKAMRFNNSNQGSITISGKTVDFVDHFTYLGTIISSSGGVEKDVESRLLIDIQAKASDLEKRANAVGLSINASKTKAMRFNNSNQGSITISGKTVDFVDHFTYLGTIISSSGGVEKDVESRLCKARSAFGRLHRIWRNQQISRRTKLRIFNACVKSILLYGAETWLTSQRMMSKLQSFINKCLRIICGIFWPNRISNSDLWRNTGEAPIHHQIKKKK
ncbi:uncharacterized protein LOC123257663 [Drosophila ananassae]|uniref:uncharacterized protein LOC123257663 n=1 Tax=Drosophila ananassae TaxID=7217 RepID=UPI001CFFADD4|nr:uncharacterized protein LOC123257663 [Drosophila ananassae]